MFRYIIIIIYEVPTHTDALQTDHLNEQSLHSSHFNNCWFARGVTAAMLVVKNKNISLLWELNSIFM